MAKLHIDWVEDDHTPGPWRVLPHRQVDLQIAGPPECVNHTDRDVATVRNLWNRDGGLERTRANARLISAAPEMLEALRALVTVLGAGASGDNMGLAKVTEAIRAAEAAIAKAEGKPADCPRKSA